MKKSKDDLPTGYRGLIDTIYKNHETAGGANRAAVAELQARTAWELNKATKGLRIATWVLAFSTIVLCIITFAK
jgi:stage V sporulation protein SpoVS